MSFPEPRNLIDIEAEVERNASSWERIFRPQLNVLSFLDEYQLECFSLHCSHNSFSAASLCIFPLCDCT